jgi:phosphoglycerate kinase
LPFTKKTLGDLDAGGKRVLVRVDFNVPLTGSTGERRVADDTRIVAARPTLEYLRDRDARLIVVSHLGRPKDREPEFSMATVSSRLAEVTGWKVSQAPDVSGPAVEELVEGLGPAGVLGWRTRT